MKYLLISENTIKMCIEVLETIDHFIRTAFKDSKRSYKSGIEEPLQGFFQIYILGLIGCISVYTFL